METAAPRKNARLASNILLGAVTISLINMAIQTLLARNWYFVAPLVVDLLFIGLCFAIRAGQLWAKILLLFLFLSIVGMKFYHLDETVQKWHEHPFAELLQTGYSIAMAWALLLLFRKPQPGVAR